MKESRGLGRFVKAAEYSWKGLKACYQNEEAFRQEFFLFLLLTPVGFWLGNDGIEKALLIGSLVLVLIVELLNSAIEALVDRVGTEHHELSGRAKDIGSAAVFVSMCNVVIVWALVIIF